MAEPTHTKISPLNLPPGYPRSSTSTSSKNSRDSKDEEQKSDLNSENQDKKIDEKIKDILPKTTLTKVVNKGSNNMIAIVI